MLFLNLSLGSFLHCFPGSILYHNDLKLYQMLTRALTGLDSGSRGLEPKSRDPSVGSGLVLEPGS